MDRTRTLVLGRRTSPEAPTEAEHADFNPLLQASCLVLNSVAIFLIITGYEHIGERTRNRGSADHVVILTPGCHLGSRR